MAKRFNHARVNMQKRIRDENRWYNKPGYEYSSNPPRMGKLPDRGWATFGISGCVGMSAPQIFFERPDKFSWLVHEDIPLRNIPRDQRGMQTRKHQWRDLMKVAIRAKCILLPPEFRSDHEFVRTVDAEGIFESVTIVEKGCFVSLGGGSKIVKRSPELDATEVYQYSHPDLGLKAMVASIEEIFIPDYCDDGQTAAGELFGDDRMFNLSKVRKLQDYFS